jgi:hypothetical protein
VRCLRHVSDVLEFFPCFFLDDAQKEMPAIDDLQNFVQEQFEEREVQPPTFSHDVLALGYEFQEASDDAIVAAIKADCKNKGQVVIIKERKHSQKSGQPCIRVTLICHNGGACASKHVKLPKDDGGRPNTRTKKIHIHVMTIFLIIKRNFSRASNKTIKTSICRGRRASFAGVLKESFLYLSQSSSTVKSAGTAQNPQMSLQSRIFPNAVIGGCSWHKLRNVADALAGKGATQGISERTQSALWKVVLRVCTGGTDISFCPREV